jgi:RNA polymerase sigma-70 factor (ECF subfamily)
MYQFVLALVHDFNAADDVLQETASVLWRKFDDFDRSGDFGAWAVGIARLEVYSYLRRQRKEKLVFSGEVVALLADELEDRHARDRVVRDALQYCVGTLDPKDRELVEQRYQPGATTKSVAESLGRSIHSIYRALNRIHTRLFRCIRLRIAEE